MTAAGSLRAGCVLLAAAALGRVALQHGVPLCEWTLCLLTVVGALHLLEGFASLAFESFRDVLRAVVVRRLRGMAFPDSLAERPPSAPEWAPPRACPRCGTVRPALVPRCPGCR